MRNKARLQPWFTWLVWVSLLLSACGTPETGIEPTSGQTPLPRATDEGSSAVVETSRPTATATPPTAPATVTAVLTRTPTPAPVAATATLRVPPADLCREYLRLSVLSGDTEKEAVATSYRCQSATIDSTGQSPSRSPDWVVHRGAPLQLRLDVEQHPTEIDVRLYPAAGVSASFLKWPEELPTNVEAVDRSQPKPDIRFQVLPQVPPGPYSLVVRIAWGEDIEVFYAQSFALQDVAPTLTSLTLIPEQAPDEVRLDVVGQIGGHSLAVAVDREKIYLGMGPRLVVLGGISASAGPLSIGQSEVLPGIVQDIVLVDNRAYVAARDAGLILLDVTDPSDVRTISRAVTPGAAQGVVLAPEAGLAYVVGGVQGGSGQAGTLSIVDVSEPERPEEVASIDVPGLAYNLALVGQHAYVAHEGGLTVLDVADPAAPTEVIDVVLPQPARDVAIADGYAYVTGQGLHVMDVSDPAHPRQVGHFETNFPPKAVAVWNELAYLSETFCEMGGCGSTVHIVDVSDPTQPQEVGAWFAQAAIQDVSIHGNALYLASWQKGLQVVDVSDAASPERMGGYATLGSVEAVAVSDGLAYVSDEAESGLQVLDLGKLSNPRVRGTAESARWAGGYAVVDGYAYVPMWADGFRVVDVRDPDDPQEVAALELGMAEQAAVLDERAYVTIGYEGLAVLDVADPLEPRVLGKLSLEGLAEGLALGGGRAYLTVDDGERSALYAIDVTDPAQPTEISRALLAGRGLNVALDRDARYAYVAIADCMYHQCSGGLQVIDIRDPSRPRSVLLAEMPGGAFDVALDGQHAFVAAGQGGVWVSDVSDPENPRATGWRDTAGRARSIVVADGLVYVADGEGGLLVLASPAAVSSGSSACTACTNRIGDCETTPICGTMRVGVERFGILAASSLSSSREGDDVGDEQPIAGLAVTQGRGRLLCFGGGTVNPLISPQELHAQLSGPNPPLVIDVRGEDAFRAGHIAGARHVPGDELEQRLAQIPRDRPVVTY